MLKSIAAAAAVIVLALSLHYYHNHITPTAAQYSFDYSNPQIDGAVHALIVGEPTSVGVEDWHDAEADGSSYTCSRIQATGYLRRWGNEYELSESGDFAIATALGRTMDWTNLAITCDPGIHRCGSLASLLPDETYELHCTVDLWVASYDGNLCSLDAGTIQVYGREQSLAMISD